MKKAKEVRKLSLALKESAMSMGMCGNGISEWGDYTTLDELCDHFWDGIEFIINHPGWPTNEWLVENIGIATLNKHGIYINKDFNLENPERLVLNGTSNGKVLASGFSTPEIYVRGNSSLKLTASDTAIIHVSLYDNAKLTVNCSQFSTVYVYKYGGFVKSTEGNGKIVVRDKTTF